MKNKKKKQIVDEKKTFIPSPEDGIKLHPMFRHLLPAGRNSDLQYLEDSLLDHGLLNPLVIWNGCLLDGYHRYDICEFHGIAVEAIEVHFDSETEAALWKLESFWASSRINMTKYAKLESYRRFENLKKQLKAEKEANNGSK